MYVAWCCYRLLIIFETKLFAENKIFLISDSWLLANQTGLLEYKIICNSEICDPIYFFYSSVSLQLPLMNIILSTYFNFQNMVFQFRNTLKNLIFIGYSKIWVITVRIMFWQLIDAKWLAEAKRLAPTISKIPTRLLRGTFHISHFTNND